MRPLALILALATTAVAAPRVRTTDPELVHGDVFEVRGFLQIHRAELGGTADERDPLEVGKRLGFLLFDDSTAEITGAAIVTRTSRALEVERLGMRLTTAAAVQRVIGRRVTQTTRYGRGVPLDCRMGGLGSCAPQVTRTTTRSVLVTEDDVSASLALRIVAGQPRLVVCVLVEPPTIEREDAGVVASSVAGFPATFDASTGAALALRPAHCL